MVAVFDEGRREELGGPSGADKEVDAERENDEGVEEEEAVVWPARSPQYVRQVRSGVVALPSLLPVRRLLDGQAVSTDSKIIEIDAWSRAA